MNCTVENIEKFTKAFSLPFTWREVGKKKMCDLIEAEMKKPTRPAKLPSKNKQQQIYDSLLPSDRKDKLNAPQTIEGIDFVPVRYSGRWRTFIQNEKATMRQENTGKAPLFSKKVDPLLDRVHTLLFGDSYARMLEPPPPDMYVVSYPGIPIKSITRSLTKTPELVDKRRSDWMDTHTLSHEAKKKKVFLTFASQIPVRKTMYKKMFHSFQDMHSYPRVDMFRQMLRFPSSSLQYIVFWFGNAELQHTFYYDLFKDPPRDPAGYARFTETYIKNSVLSYLQFLETVAKLEPTTTLVVILMNYSPVHSKEMQQIVPVKNLRSFPRDMVDAIFADTTRRQLVDQFNIHLSKVVEKHFPKGKIKLININSVIFNSKTGSLYPEFVLHPKDIHVADPHRKLYRFLLKEIYS